MCSFTHTLICIDLFHVNIVPASSVKLLKPVNQYLRHGRAFANFMYMFTMKMSEASFFLRSWCDIGRELVHLSDWVGPYCNGRAFANFMYMFTMKMSEASFFLRSWCDIGRELVHLSDWVGPYCNGRAFANFMYMFTMKMSEASFLYNCIKPKCVFMYLSQFQIALG